MSRCVCICAAALGYPTGGGHMWVYLNWALGLRAAGCEVIWLETVHPEVPTAKAAANAALLRERLKEYDLDRSLVVCVSDASGEHSIDGYAGIESAERADLLLNLRYSLSASVVKRFRRTALLDIDPGLTQIWADRGEVKMSPHDFYFTIGETVGQPGSPIPDLGVKWHHTPPAVYLPEWQVVSSDAAAPFTTVSHWYSDEWMSDQAGGWYRNDKRSGFLPFLDLPRMLRRGSEVVGGGLDERLKPNASLPNLQPPTSDPQLTLELALCLGQEPERAELLERGWRITDSEIVSGTPADYRKYVQQSRGEFSCAKPSWTRLQNAWVSDRTICYLASGKPAVVQHTGPSRYLPDSAGMLRFKTIEEAAACLESAANDYDRHSRAARALAEEFFDARTVASRVLEIALN